MTLKIRCLENKIIKEEGDRITAWISQYMIGEIQKDRNCFIFATRNEHGNVIRRLGVFEILKVGKKKHEFGGSGGEHRECKIRRMMI